MNSFVCKAFKSYFAITSGIALASWANVCVAGIGNNLGLVTEGYAEKSAKFYSQFIITAFAMPIITPVAFMMSRIRSEVKKDESD